MAFAAQQLPSRQIQRPSHGINHRHFHCALGKGIAPAGEVHAGQRGFKARAILVQQGRSQISIDGVLDAFG